MPASHILCGLTDGHIRQHGQSLRRAPGPAWHGHGTATADSRLTKRLCLGREKPFPAYSPSHPPSPPAAFACGGLLPVPSSARSTQLTAPGAGAPAWVGSAPLLQPPPSCISSGKPPPLPLHLPSQSLPGTYPR